MIVTEFLKHVNYALRGTDEPAPNIGSDEANYWLDAYNSVKDEFYNDINVLWEETWSIESLGVVTASATYEIDAPDNLIAPSDQIYIVDTNSKKHYYDLVKPKERSSVVRKFYIAGMNPKVIYCSNEIASTEDIVGGTLYLPGYYMPDDIVVASETGTSEIDFVDPYYAVYATASEIAFNDMTFEDKASDLAGKANMRKQKMIRRNRKNQYGIPRKIPRSVRRIRNTEYR